MRAAAFAAVVATVAGWAAAAGADSPYRDDARVAYLGRTLADLQGADRTWLADHRRYLYDQSRGACSSAFDDVRLSCLLRAARARCDARPPAARPACHRVSDVIVTNRQSEGDFVSNRRRYDLMRRGGSFTGALLAELSDRYAELTVEFTLSPHFTDPRAPAAGVSRFCAARAGASDLSWQRCAAAILWYIAVDGDRP